MPRHDKITVTLHQPDSEQLHRLHRELCGFFAAQAQAKLEALAPGSREAQLALLDRLIAGLAGEESAPREGGGG